MLYFPQPEGRICLNCHQWITYANLVKRSDTKSGVRSICQSCNRAAKARYSRKSYAKDPQRFLDYDRNYIQAHPEQRRQTRAKYRANHRTREREQQRKRREQPAYRAYMKEYLHRYGPAYERRRANDPKYRDIRHRWRQNHPEISRAINHRRHAQKRNLPAQFDAKDWKLALGYFDHRCAVCGRPAGLWHTIAADHWIPLSSPDCPGTVVTNIVPMCHGVDGCNNSKNAKNPVEWLNDKFGPRKAKQILARIEAYFAWVKQVHVHSSD